MSVLLSLPGKSFSSFSVDMLFPPSQTDCPTDQTPQGVPFTETTVCTAAGGDPVLGSTTTPVIPWTCIAPLLHSNVHVSNHLFVKCPSSPLDCQGRDRDFPVHLKILSTWNSASAHRMYSVSAHGPGFYKVEMSTCHAISNQPH